MSSFQYLFGNVDESGKLEQDALDEELRETLQSEEASNYLSQVLSLDVPADEDSTKGKKPQLGGNFDVSGPGMIKPSANAVDYSDMQEMFPVPETPIDNQINMNLFDLPQLPTGNQPDLSQIFDLFSSIAPMTMIPPAKPHFDEEKLEEIFPGYKSGRLKFSDLFSARLNRQSVKKLDFVKRVRGDNGYPVDKDERCVFVSSMRLPPRIKVPDEPEKSYFTESASKRMEEQMDSNVFSSLLLDPWEDRIIWDADQVENDTRMSDAVSSQITVTLNHSQDNDSSVKFTFMNKHLENDDWLDAVVWDEEDAEASKPNQFHLDDPMLPITEENIQTATQSDRSSHLSRFVRRSDGKIVERFNISDDHHYEQVQSRGGRVRQTHGPVAIIHSVPALKLHPQLLKTVIPVRELRSFHRPPFKFPINEEIKFDKLKPFKKKKYVELDPTEYMRTPKDLTMRDTSKYVLVEYSEEYPPVLQNVGMGCLITNYYRKKDDRDNFTPKLPHGTPHILESVDASPFFGFGEVETGTTMQSLNNNLFRAPLFPHDVNQHQFLLIRHTHYGMTKYYIRMIPAIFVVGQLFPIQEVPRPQARKVTQMLKMRMQVTSYRLIMNDKHGRISFKRLKKAYPMFNDEQIRFKLKEFARYAKKGENTGWWKLKPNFPLPNEDGIRKFLTPESICLAESTLVGQQRLRDAGYGNGEFENEEEENESQDIEVQLAPWITTKNFVAAAAGKGMLQLFGPGDPTGCGQGFSYIRASMKEMFFHQGDSEHAREAFVESKAKITFHKYSIAEQQQVYRSEIKRIWGNQVRSLSASTFQQEAVQSEAFQALQNQKHELEMEEERQRRLQYGVTSAGSPPPFSPLPSGSRNDDEYSDVESKRDTESIADSLAGKDRVLVINRLVKKEDKTFEWKSEVVTNTRVINAYLRQRQLIEHQDNSGINLSEEDMKKVIRKRTKAQVVKLQLKQGKKPTYDDVEVAEHADKIVVKSTRNHENEPLKSLPVILKIPTLPDPSTESSPPAKRRKKTGPKSQPLPEVHVEEEPQESKSFSTHRRASPEVEMSAVFEAIVAKIIDSPDAWPFVRPVMPSVAPGYYDVIKKPKCFENVRDDIRNFHYTTVESFVHDVSLIAENCQTYNGQSHPLTATIWSIVRSIQRQLDPQMDFLRKLETDIAADRGIPAVSAPETHILDHAHQKRSPELVVISPERNGIAPIQPPPQN